MQDGAVPPLEAIAGATAGEITISEGKTLNIGLKLRYADADQCNKAKQGIEKLVKQGVGLAGARGEQGLKGLADGD